MPKLVKHQKFRKYMIKVF